MGYFEQALSTLPHLPEQRAIHEQAIDLWCALRSALYPSGDWGHIVTYLREAESLAVALDDPHRLGQVSILLSNHFSVMGACDQAIAAAQRALALATASGEVALYVLANQRLGQAYHFRGDYRRALDCFGQTVASLEGARRHERFGQVVLPAVLSRGYLAWCYAELGMFAEGSVIGEEGLRIAEAVEYPLSFMWASWGQGLLCLFQGNLPRALLLLERAVDICQDMDLPVYFPRIAVALGTAYTLGGRVADAVPLLTQAMEQATAMGTVEDQALCRLAMGEVQVLTGRLEEAYAHAEHALALAHAHRKRGNQAYVRRLLGDIAPRREPPKAEQAAAHFRQAQAQAEELGMRPLWAHCHLSLGKLYVKTGRHAAARVELTAATEVYRAMEMTFWLPQAETALAEVGGH